MMDPGEPKFRRLRGDGARDGTVSPNARLILQMAQMAAHNSALRSVALLKILHEGEGVSL
jgi:hypothetical protein